MLDIYRYDEDNNAYLIVSKNGLQTAPIQTTHNGTTGETTVQQLYLKSDSSLYWYEDITLQPIPESAVKVGASAYPEAYISFKILVQGTMPTDDQWKNTASGAITDFYDIGSLHLGDTNLHTFWIQINIPAGTPPGTLTHVSIRLSRTENPVVP